MTSISNVTVGTEIKGRYFTMIVTEIKNNRIFGFDKQRFIKTGKEENISIKISDLKNPHYKVSFS